MKNYRTAVILAGTDIQHHWVIPRVKAVDHGCFIPETTELYCSAGDKPQSGSEAAMILATIHLEKTIKFQYHWGIFLRLSATAELVK